MRERSCVACRARVANAVIEWSRNQLWNCTHFRHPTDEQLRHVDIFFSNYYNLQSVYFEFLKKKKQNKTNCRKPP